MGERLGIFVVYNKQGVVERYMVPLMQGLRECCQKLLVVSNGWLQPEGTAMVSSYADEVFCRENVGFDCGAVQDVLLHLYGWENVMKFDELVIMNDTCYGPFYPLADVFKSMDQINCDFWGLTDYGPMQADPSVWGITQLPYHIQSFFFVTRKALLHSACFRNYWEGLKLSDDYYGAVKNYELKMTTYFHDNGFKSSTYVKRRGEIPYCYVYYEPYQLVRHYRMPLVKRKAQVFCLEDNIPFFSSFERARLLRYLQEEGLYDISMILEDISHKYSEEIAGGLQGASLAIEQLQNFCNGSGMILIYGAGVYAQMVANTFAMEGVDFDGFLVSDGHRKEGTKNSRPVYELSEVSGNAGNIGVVLGLENSYYDTVIGALHAKGINRIFAV